MSKGPITRARAAREWAVTGGGRPPVAHQTRRREGDSKERCLVYKIYEQNDEIFTLFVPVHGGGMFRVILQIKLHLSLSLSHTHTHTHTHTLEGVDGQQRTAAGCTQSTQGVGRIRGVKEQTIGACCTHDGESRRSVPPAVQSSTAHSASDKEANERREMKGKNCQ